MSEFIKKHREGVNAVLGVILIVAVLGIIFVISENTGDRSMDKEPIVEVNPLLEEGETIDESKMKELTSITFDEFKEYLNKKSTTVIMLGYDTCYWCQQQKPILQMLMYDKDIDVKYLDVTTLTTEENNYLVDLHEDLEGYGTPTFISVKNKKVREVSPNAKSTSQLIEMFTEMGILE